MLKTYIFLKLFNLFYFIRLSMYLCTCIKKNYYNQYGSHSSFKTIMLYLIKQSHLKIIVKEFSNCLPKFVLPELSTFL